MIPHNHPISIKDSRSRLPPIIFRILLHMHLTKHIEQIQSLDGIEFATWSAPEDVLDMQTFVARSRRGGGGGDEQHHPI